MPSSMLRSAPAVLIASAALFLAASGGAVAGSLITGKQIKDNTVTTKDVRNRTLTTKDFAPATIASLAGDTGPAGAPGTDGVTGYEVVNGEDANIANNGGAYAEAICPAGKVATGGGAFWAGGGGGDLSTMSSGPVRALRDGDGVPTGGTGYPTAEVADMWFASGTNHAGGVRSLEVYVLCAVVD